MTQKSKILSFDKVRKGALRRGVPSDRYVGLDYYGERYGSSSAWGGSPVRLAGASRTAHARNDRSNAATFESRSLTETSVSVQRGGKSKGIPSAFFAEEAPSPVHNVNRAQQEDEFQYSAKEQRARNREQVKRARAKAKAEKAFSKQFGAFPSDAAGDAGPRAAVYEGKMGSNHKRAARLQAPDAAALKNFGFAPLVLLQSLASGVIKALMKPRSAVLASAAVCLVLVAGFLYPSARTYYQAVREQARLEIEYAALEDRNQALSDNVAYLQTDAGIEARARSQYGWVKEGEQAGSVSGVDAVQEDAQIAAKVLSEEIKPPTTWYSAVLDPLFGVES